MKSATRIMGVVNLTPDSFSGDGIYKKETGRRKPAGGIVDRAVKIAEKMVEGGADIIDLGGESTRPGARPVSVSEEIDRVIPVVKKLVKKIKAPISIDTSKREVALQALDLGVSIINDISGLHNDPYLAELAGRYNAGMVIMHMKGNPRTMQRSPRYKSLISEIINYLKNSVRIAVQAGVNSKKIIVDPGIGFGKTTAHNLEILRRLREFKVLGKPLLVGTSRKSVIGDVLGLPVEQRLWGTAATVAIAINNGADIVRIHDVGEMAEVARMADAIARR